MVQKQSMLNVADNSGAKKVMVIGIPGGTRKRYAYLGDIIKITIKSAIPGGTVKKGEVWDAVIVRTKKEFKREDGSYIRFDENAAVILDKAGQMIGTRISGPVAKELRSGGYSKVISLAPEVL